MYNRVNVQLYSSACSNGMNECSFCVTAPSRSENIDRGTKSAFYVNAHTTTTPTFQNLMINPNLALTLPPHVAGMQGVFKCSLCKGNNPFLTMQVL